MHSSLLFKDGNVDISIQRVDELHLHQDANMAAGDSNEEMEEKGDLRAIGQAVVAGDFFQREGNEREGNESGVPGKLGSYEGAEVPIPDMHDGRDMFDSSVSRNGDNVHVKM